VLRTILHGRGSYSLLVRDPIQSDDSRIFVIFICFFFSQALDCLLGKTTSVGSVFENIYNTEIGARLGFQ